MNKSELRISEIKARALHFFELTDLTLTWDMLKAAIESTVDQVVIGYIQTVLVQQRNAVVSPSCMFWNKLTARVDISPAKLRKVVKLLQDEHDYRTVTCKTNSRLERLKAKCYNWSHTTSVLKNCTVFTGSFGGRLIIVNLDNMFYVFRDGAHNFYNYAGLTHTEAFDLIQGCANKTSPALNLWIDGVQDDIESGKTKVVIGEKMVCGVSNEHYCYYLAHTKNSINVHHWQGSDERTKSMFMHKLNSLTVGAK